MLQFLKLIRFDNIFLVIFAQWSIKNYIFKPFQIAITLDDLRFSFLLISTACIMAAGNIIIAIYDSDLRNEPLSKMHAIHETVANRWFIVLNAIGVLIGFYLSNSIDRSGFAALFICTSGIFYIYASYLKEILIVKNVLPALLVALGLLVVPIFDLLPAITPQNQPSQTVVFSIIWDYAIFAFVIILIREVIKDCSTTDIDYNRGLKTIPIVIGKERTLKMVSILFALPVFMVVYYVYTYLFNKGIIVGFLLVGILAPLLFCLFRSWTASSQKDYKILTLVLKVVLLITALSILLYPFILL